MKDITNFVVGGLIVFVILSIVLGGVVFDKNDWIFGVLIIGLLILNKKINIIIELLSKKKK